MSKITDMESFMKNYLRDAEEYGAMSIREYAAENRTAADADFGNALKEASLDYRRSLPSYGVLGSKLDTYGLDGSGYANYLSDKARGEYDSAVTEAKAGLMKSNNSLMNGYSKYIEQFATDRSALRRNVQDKLISRRVYDMDAAYDYGISAGLTPEEARTISTTVYNSLRGDAKKKVIDRAISLRLDAEGTKKYAISMGLNEADAISVADEAADLLKHYSEYTDGYWDYLNNKSGDADGKEFADFRSWYLSRGGSTDSSTADILDSYRKYLEHIKKLENDSVGIYD